jgi:hypothetical protein
MTHRAQSDYPASSDFVSAATMVDHVGEGSCLLITSSRLACGPESPISAGTFKLGYSKKETDRPNRDGEGLGPAILPA